MKEHEWAAIEKAAKLTAELEKSPMLAALRAEEAAAILATRKEAAAKIEVLEKDRAAVIPKLQVDLEAKEGRHKKALSALDAAAGEFNRARAALSMESQSFDSAIHAQERVLIESADPAIDEAITFFRGKLDFFRSPGRISRTAGGSINNLFTWTRATKEESNLPAVNDALSYCQAAIRALEAAKLTPEVDLEKIEMLKTGVPDIDKYTKIVGEKPMDKGPDPSFLARQDREFDAKIKALLSKRV
jgi:hypothetical protein